MSSAHILIVEDEAVLSDAYEMILKSQGYDVATAHDGEEALEHIENRTPDLILLDLRMPKVSGIDFLRSAHLHENHPSTKVLVFSNLDTQKEIDSAYELGANRYILKAWASPKELIQIVGDTLKDPK